MGQIVFGLYVGSPVQIVQSDQGLRSPLILTVPVFMVIRFAFVYLWFNILEPAHDKT